MEITDQILNKIKEYNTIIIHRHESPDPDALGSQAGLAELLRNTYPDKHIYQVGGSVGNLAWLAEENEVDDDVYQDALVIVIDTANTPRVSDQRFATGKFIIKIDHHPNDDPYGNINWISETASSCSAMVVDLFNASHGELKMSPAAARLLYAGIVGDTGRFLYSNTTAHTFALAAQLLATGFDNSAVTLRLNEVTLQQAKLQSYVYNHLTIADNGAAYIILSQAVLDELGLNVQTASAAVSTPGRLSNVIDWLIFVEQSGAFKYRVHLRSKGPVINELAKEHNGGGHPLASGAKALDDNEVQEMITGLIKLTDEARAKEQNN